MAVPGQAINQMSDLVDCCAGYSDDAQALPPAEASATLRGAAAEVKTSNSSMHGSAWLVVARMVIRAILPAQV